MRSRNCREGTGERTGRGTVRRYEDREDAARALIAELPPELGPEWLVLGLPRGGVPIAAALARHLGAPLDLLVVRKVGTPGQPELALAAVTGPGDADLIENPQVRRSLGLSDERLRALARDAAAQLEQRRRRWTGDRPEPRIEGRNVLLVDDGVATGTTLAAAVEALRRGGAARIAVAVPVALGRSLDRIAGRVDHVICPLPAAPFGAVSLAYDSFPQVGDEVVARLLAESPAPQAG